MTPRLPVPQPLPVRLPVEELEGVPEAPALALLDSQAVGDSEKDGVALPCPEPLTVLLGSAEAVGVSVPPRASVGEGLVVGLSSGEEDLVLTLEVGMGDTEAEPVGLADTQAEGVAERERWGVPELLALAQADPVALTAAVAELQAVASAEGVGEALVERVPEAVEQAELQPESVTAATDIVTEPLLLPVTEKLAQPECVVPGLSVGAPVTLPEGLPAPVGDAVVQAELLSVPVPKALAVIQEVLLPERVPAATDAVTEPLLLPLEERLPLTE